MAEYGFLDRVLHRIALQGRSVGELCLDLDARSVKADPPAVVGMRHVFVSGLARAGTTVLMRRFYAANVYRSLTYRDMPFVLAPNLWGRLHSRSTRDIVQAERAHGDRILVDADSPESLDEVFWRVCAGDDYIRATHLSAHTASEETIQRFRRYVAAILADAPPNFAYLSKNNNNVLRLGSIRAAFPEAMIVTPFRAPLSQARSLMRQHEAFTKMQADDPFVRRYMTWLGHHEFGSDHRPFWFRSDAPFRPSEWGPDTLEHWLEIWCETYEYLAARAPADVLFVCYEDICADPRVWDRLAVRAGIPAGAGAAENPFEASRASTTDAETADPSLRARAEATYEALRERMNATLS